MYTTSERSPALSRLTGLLHVRELLVRESLVYIIHSYTHTRSRRVSCYTLLYIRLLHTLGRDGERENVIGGDRVQIGANNRHCTRGARTRSFVPLAIIKRYPFFRFPLVSSLYDIPLYYTRVCVFNL